MIDVIIMYLANIDSSLLIIIISALAGSYGKDYLRIMKSSKPEKVSLTNVLLSTFTATLFAYGFSIFLIEKFGERILAIFSFVCGLIGFQLMEQLSTIDGILRLKTKIYGPPQLLLPSHYKEKNDDDK